MKQNTIFINTTKTHSEVSVKTIMMLVFPFLKKWWSFTACNGIIDNLTLTTLTNDRHVSHPGYLCESLTLFFLFIWASPEHPLHFSAWIIPFFLTSHSQEDPGGWPKAYAYDPMHGLFFHFYIFKKTKF